MGEIIYLIQGGLCFLSALSTLQKNQYLFTELFCTDSSPVIRTKLQVSRTIYETIVKIKAELHLETYTVFGFHVIT